MAGVSEPPGLLSEGHQDRQEGFEVRIILEDRRERGERRGWRGVRQELEECRRGVLVWDIDGGVGIGWEMKNEGTVVVADCSCSFCWWNMNFMFDRVVDFIAASFALSERQRVEFDCSAGERRGRYPLTSTRYQLH